MTSWPYQEVIFHEDPQRSIEMLIIGSKLQYMWDANKQVRPMHIWDWSGFPNHTENIGPQQYQKLPRFSDILMKVMWIGTILDSNLGNMF